MSSVNSMIQSVSSIFNSAQSFVDRLSDGNRIQLKELAKNVAEETNQNPQDVLTFVTYFARNSDSGYVSRGKNGGFVKGERKAKSPVATSTVVNSTTPSVNAVETQEVSHSDEVDSDSSFDAFVAEDKEDLFDLDS